LKVKIRSLLTVVAMLSILLFSVGTAHAVLGVADDVPANAVVLPVIATVANGGLNTVFAIAETTCPSVIDPVVAVPQEDPAIPFASGNAVIVAHYQLSNTCSGPVASGDVPFTCHDVVPFNFHSMMTNLSNSQKTQMSITIDGVAYWAGYITFSNQVTPDDDLIAWVYLTDLGQGFASGFNAIGLEGGAGPRMEEDSGNAAITVNTLYPRYQIVNAQANTWNWWFVLAGRNQIGSAPANDNPNVDGVVYGCGFSNCSNSAFTRLLKGIICNEQEDCPDFQIYIPRELNIINVGEILPNIHASKYPKNGFAILQVEEDGDIGGISHIITGTTDASVCTFTQGTYYSMFGWSYQRAESETLPITANWDVIHPMHRAYCDSPPSETYVSGLTCGLDL
jgi:hypothetical protein